MTVHSPPSTSLGTRRSGWYFAVCFKILWLLESPLCSIFWIVCPIFERSRLGCFVLSSEPPGDVRLFVQWWWSTAPQARVLEQGEVIMSIYNHWIVDGASSYFYQFHRVVFFYGRCLSDGRNLLALWFLVYFCFKAWSKIGSRLLLGSLHNLFIWGALFGGSSDVLGISTLLILQTLEVLYI